MKGAIAAVIFTALLLVFVLTLGWVNVKPSEVAVEINKVAGKVIETPKGVGYHFFNRWVTDMVVYKVAARAFPGDTAGNEESQKYNLELKTNDGQNISVDLTIIYSLVAKEVPNLHQQIGPNYEDQILLPQVRSEARIVIGGYSAEQIYQGNVRNEIQKGILDRLKTTLKDYGFPAGGDQQEPGTRAGRNGQEARGRSARAQVPGRTESSGRSRSGEDQCRRKTLFAGAGSGRRLGAL
jgi:regulator of protease activity HflC (stomatin/prohibitin superfamily)